MMKNILIMPLLLFALVTFGQQTEESAITKPIKELKPFKFELEYTPLSDIQPVFLFKTKKNNYLGIKILSSSLFTLSNDKTIELFQINPITGFQTTIFIGLNSTPYFTLNHVGDNDILSVFYRKPLPYFKNSFVDFGLCSNLSFIKDAPDYILFFGGELSYQIELKKYISIGSTIKFGPIIHNDFDIGLVYGGIGINLSYLVINFKLY